MENIKEFPLMDKADGIVLFHPTIPASALESVNKVLNSRWIGQGPIVDRFEFEFKNKFSSPCNSLAVGSGTDALHLAYLLAGIQQDDEVIVPVFTCTATNIPLLYIGAKIVFCDIDSNMNIDASLIENLITPRTKAIVCVHYGGVPCDMELIWMVAKSYGLIVIEDAAHALGATYNGNMIGSQSDFSMFSFQAIKHITTGDGGMLTIKKEADVSRAKKLRWFGIDREKKQNAIWENDITEVGYKYQMTDISAALGIAGIQDFDTNLHYRKLLFKKYCDNLNGIKGLRIIGTDIDINLKTNAAWLLTVEVDQLNDFIAHLRKFNIECAQVHYRNDRYSIFKKFAIGKEFPRMDWMENRYAVLPLHTVMKIEDVDRISEVIKLGWIH